jgi:hypothetical protein
MGIEKTVVREGREEARSENQEERIGIFFASLRVLRG